MKTKTIEIRTEKTVNVLETEDFINFLEDNHAMDAFREECLRCEGTSSSFVLNALKLNEYASGPDFVRNYLTYIYDMFVQFKPEALGHWFQRIIADSFRWDLAVNGYTFWSIIDGDWRRMCADAEADCMEIN